MLFAQGTPMIAAGDELGHSQGGNNNPYCQDNATSWIDWSLADDDLVEFTARLIALRRRWLPLGSTWLDGLPADDGVADLHWLGSEGQPLHADDWHDAQARVLGALISRAGNALLLLVNAGSEDQRFALPTGVWRTLLDTADARGGAADTTLEGHRTLSARSLVLLVR
jgi:glycogen operon protein